VTSKDVGLVADRAEMIDSFEAARIALRQVFEGDPADASGLPRHRHDASWLNPEREATRSDAAVW